MITDENHPEMIRAAEELGKVLNVTFVGKPLDGQVVVDMNAVIMNHRELWARRGVEFPVLAALVVPRLSVIDLVNADLAQDTAAMGLRVVAFARRHAQATRAEVLQAFSWAFPDHAEKLREMVFRRLHEVRAGRGEDSRGVRVGEGGAGGDGRQLEKGRPRRDQDY